MGCCVIWVDKIIVGLSKRIVGGQNHFIVLYYIIIGCDHVEVYDKGNLV